MSKSNRYFIYSNPKLFPLKETNEFFKGIVDILEGTPGKQRGDLVFCAVRKYEGEIRTSTGELVVVHTFVASSLYRWDGVYWECVLPGNLRRFEVVKENGKYIGEEGEMTDLEKARQEKSGGGCSFACPGRGDCANEVGLPGKSIPGQHDGPDDTIDVYGKPNGWCWSCWRSRRINDLETALGKAIDAMGVRADRINRWKTRYDEMRELVRQACIDRSEHIPGVVKYGEYSGEGDCTEYTPPKELPNIPKLEQDRDAALASEKHLRDLLATERGNVEDALPTENDHE